MKPGLFFVKPVLPAPPPPPPPPPTAEAAEQAAPVAAPVTALVAAPLIDQVIVHRVPEASAAEKAGEAALARAAEADDGPECLLEAPFKAMDARHRVRYAGPKVVVGSGKNAKYRLACIEKGCTNRARQGVAGKLHCTGHGGGVRCSVQGCKSGANGGTAYCLTHGGGFRCQIEENHPVAPAPSAYYRLPEVPRNARKNPRLDLSKLRCCLKCKRMFSFES